MNDEMSLPLLIVEFIMITVRVIAAVYIWNIFVPGVKFKYDTADLARASRRIVSDAFKANEVAALGIVLIALECVILYLPSSGLPLSMICVSGLFVAFVLFRNKEYLPDTVAALSVYFGTRYLLYFLVNAISTPLGQKLMQGIESAEDLDRFVYVRTNFLHGFIDILFVLLLIISIIPIRKIIQVRDKIGWLDCGLIAVLNAASIILSMIMMRLSVVATSDGAFVLTDEKPYLLWLMPVVAFMLYAGELAVLLLWQKHNESQRKAALYLSQKLEKEAIANRLLDMKDYYEDVAKVRHEMTNHITTIKALARAGHMDELDKYIKNVDENIRSVTMLFSTGNPVTDVVLNDKARRAKKSDVNFQISFTFDKEWGISEFDLSVLISNLLDNAIRAASGVDGRKYVSFRTKEREHIIIFICENSYKDEAGEKRQNELWHGLGLKIIEEIADRYDGAMRIEKGEDVSTATVMLKKKRLFTTTK